MRRIALSLAFLATLVSTAFAAQDPVVIGVNPNNGQGDPLRRAAIRLNKNDAELYAAIANIQSVIATLVTANPVTSVAGRGGAVTLTSTDLSDATSLGRSILATPSATSLRGLIGAAPIDSPAFTGTPSAATFSLTGVSASGNLLGATFGSPSGAPYATPLTQILSSTYSLASEGRWGASQADNDRIFGLALARSANLGLGPVTIDIPMGSWTFTVPQTLTTSKPFKIQCSGRGSTRINVSTGSSSLLTLTQTTAGAQVSVDGCEFAATAPAVATPLVVKFSGTPQGPSPFYQYATARFSDLSFVGSDHTPTTGVNYFTSAIDLSNAWAPILDAIHFTGSVENQRGSASALTFRYSFSPQITNFFAYYTTRCIYDPGGATNGQNSEGMAWRSGECIGADYGMDLVGTDSDPGLFVGQVHVNASKSCVRSIYKSQLSIDGMLCYKLFGDAANFTAFDLQNVAYGQISNIQIGDSRSTNNGGNFNGIVLTNSIGVTVSNVQAQGWQNTGGSLLYLAGTTSATRVRHLDAGMVTGLNPVGFDGTVAKNNVFTGVIPALLQGLTVNAPTPSVGNDRSGMWTTANSAATSITNFPDAVAGQRITVFFQDAATTLVHGSPMRLKGATNASPPAGSTISFLYLGSYWVETSRSF